MKPKPKKHRPLVISMKDHKRIAKRVRALEKKHGLSYNWKSFKTG